MKSILIYFLIVIVTSACFIEEKQDLKNNLEVKEPINKTENQGVNFQYSDFPIKKGQLGKIKIGMTITQAEEKFNGLRKEIGESTSLGYGGGGPAYLYYDNNDPVFALIPKLGKDTIFVIIAASKKLHTESGLNPKSTVNDILKVYPDIMVNLDMFNGWEYFADSTYNWDFYFTSTRNNLIGEYDIEKHQFSSKPMKLNVKADWITIK